LFKGDFYRFLVGWKIKKNEPAIWQVGSSWIIF